MTRDLVAEPQFALVSALKALGGVGHLSEIEAQCAKLGRPIPGPSIRRLLQQYSTDATWDKSVKPPLAPDLFYSVDGVERATGFWGLRGFSVEAPGAYPIPGLRRAHTRLLERRETTLFNMRGIAYRDGIVHGIEVRFTPNSTYPDRLREDGYIDHIGEGRDHVQTDSGGNHGMLEALSQQYPIPVFQSIGPDGGRRYAALGYYQVVDVTRRPLQVDENDFETDAFVFTLEPVSLPTLTQPATGAVNVDSVGLGTEYSSNEPEATLVDEIPVEGQHRETMVVKSARDDRVATRTESKLVLSLKTYIEGKGMTTMRHRIRPGGEPAILLTDMFIKERRLLIEAKGTADRASFRMALGQLADYRRFIGNPDCAILVPHKPRPDLLDLARIADVSLIWPAGDGFTGTLDL